MRVVFDADALNDVERIFEWHARINRRAAETLIARIFGKAERLETPGLADMGRPGLDPGTRELIEFPYIIVYEVREGSGDIVILSIVHGAQDRDNRGA
jgi:plasmid stabilization system protein ParE